MTQSEDESVVIEKILNAIEGSMTTQNEKVNSLKSIVAGLDAELDGISQMFEHGHNEPCSETQGGLLRHQPGRMASSLSVLQTENDSVKQQLHEKEDDVLEIQKMIGLVEKQSDKLVHINDEIQKYEIDVNLMRKDLVGEQLKTPPQLSIAAVKQPNDAFDMKTALGSIISKYNQMEQDSLMNKHLQQAIDELQKEKQQEVRALKQQMEQTRQSLSEKNSKLSSKQQALQAQLAQARGSVSALQSELSRAKGESEQLRRQVSGMHSELKLAGSSHGELKRLVRNADSERAALHDAMQRQSDELSRYQTSKEQQAETANAQLKQLQREITQKDRKRQEDQRALKELQRSLNEAEKMVNSFREDKVGLVAEVKSAVRVQAMLRRQIENFKQESAAQQRTIATLTEQNKQMTTSKDSATVSKYVYKYNHATVNEHRGDGLALMNNVKDLKCASAIVQDKIDAMRARTKQMQSGLSGLKSTSASSGHAKVQRRSCLMSLKADIERIQNSTTF